MFFLGASKGDDEHRRIYNPICEENDYQKLIKKNVLDSFGRYKCFYNFVVIIITTHIHCKVSYRGHT